MSIGVVDIVEIPEPSLNSASYRSVLSGGLTNVRVGGDQNLPVGGNARIH
jgi:hypothetical protein